MLDEYPNFYKYKKAIGPYIELTKQFIDTFFEDDETVEDLRLVMQMVLTTREHKNAHQMCFYLKDDGTTSINGDIVSTRNCRAALAKLQDHGLIQVKEMKDRSCSDAKIARYFWWDPRALLHAVGEFLAKHDEEPEPKANESLFRCPTCEFGSYSASDVAFMCMKSDDHEAHCPKCNTVLETFVEMKTSKRDFTDIARVVVNMKREEIRCGSKKACVMSPAFYLKLRLKRSQLPAKKILADGRTILFGVNLQCEIFTFTLDEPTTPEIKRPWKTFLQPVWEPHIYHEHAAFKPNLDSLLNWDSDEDDWDSDEDCVND